MGDKTQDVILITLRNTTFGKSQLVNLMIKRNFFLYKKSEIFINDKISSKD
jgi:hypothetical protein